MKIFKKNLLINFTIIFSIFFLDQITKIYVINLFNEKNDMIILSKFLNIDLIWNQGIAFGLLSFDQNFYYNLISFLIILVLIGILIVLYRNNDLTSYFYCMIFGGACGNLIDRIRYQAVPDFIDFHIGEFHWFIFNVADIFISFGVFFMILIELIDNNKSNEKV